MTPIRMILFDSLFDAAMAILSIFPSGWD